MENSDTTQKIVEKMKQLKSLRKLKRILNWNMKILRNKLKKIKEWQLTSIKS